MGLSLIFYLSVFAISIFCFYVAEHLPKNQKKFSGILFATGIIIICLVAGLRGEDVGVDVKVYIVNSCSIAKNLRSLGEVFSNMSLNAGGEYLFGFLLYVCTRFGHSVQLLLFALQFLTIWPIFKACKLIKNKYNDFSIPLAMATYLFLYFNNTLNMMRQSVAISFLILGVVSIICDKRKRDYIIPFIIAVLAHKSSLIGIVLLLIVKYLYHNRKKIKKFYAFILSIAIVFIPVIIQAIYNLLIKLGVSNEHFDYYNDIFILKKVDVNWFINPLSSYSLSFLVFVILFASFLLLSYHKNKKNIDEEKRRDQLFFSSIVLYGYLIYVAILFSFKTMYGIRISIILDMFNIIALPLCVSSKKKYLPMISLLLIICWFILIMRLGWSGSNIYTLFD